MAKTLLLGLMLGIAAVAGGAEGHAPTVLEAGRKIAPTTPEPALVPARLKRHGLHRGFGRVHESFRSPRSFAGKRLRHGGVIVRKGLVDPRFSASKPFRARGVSSKGGFVDLRQISRKRFGMAPLAPARGSWADSCFRASACAPAVPSSRRDRSARRSSASVSRTAPWYSSA